MNNGTGITLSTITHRSDFLIAAASGKKFVVSTLVLQTTKRRDDHPVPNVARAGFTVTKKMGNAVARNRIKRRLRAAVREIAPKHALPGHDYVIISRPHALTCDYSEILRDMEFAFSRITANKGVSTQGSTQ